MTWFNLIAGLASIIGLGLSLGAWIEARRAAQKAERASEAAKEARDAITIRSLIDEFQHACADSSQLFDFLAHDRLAEALLRANELASVLSEIPHRRSAHLTEKQKLELGNIRQDALRMAEQLSSSQQPPLPTEQRQRLIRQCQKISAVLRENLGKIKGEMDTGAK